MAKRRMFSTDIVRSDAFLDLPVSSRELYFQLGMDTDDRGYVANAKSIIRMIGGNVGDLQPLVQGGFIMVRGEGLLLQKHFRINNSFHGQHIIETEYLEDLRKLCVKDNGSYTENQSEGEPVKLPKKKGSSTDSAPTLHQVCTNDGEEVVNNLTKRNLTKLNGTKHNITKLNQTEPNGTELTNPRMSAFEDEKRRQLGLLEKEMGMDVGETPNPDDQPF